MADLKLSVPAIEKLLDYVASGIGAVAGPVLLPWKAFFEGKAKRIAARSEADALQIISEARANARHYLLSPDVEACGTVEITRDDVRERIEFQERKRLANIGSVVRGAAESLGDRAVSDHEPDPDWTARFFNSAQDVSSEDLQNLWARILAGEIESPGRTSLRTLSILKDMTQREARQFFDLMQFGISNFILIECLRQIPGDRGRSWTAHLNHVGLLYSGLGISPHVKLDDKGTFLVEHCGHMLIIEGAPRSEVNLIEAAPLTTSGQELAGFCEHEPNLEYLSCFAGFLAKQNYLIKLAPIIGTDLGGRPYCRRSELRIIEPAAMQR